MRFAFIYTKTAPQFGQESKGEFLERIKSSKNYNGKEFVNLIKTELLMDPMEMVKVSYQFMTATGLNPPKPVPSKIMAL